MCQNIYLIVNNFMKKNTKKVTSHVPHSKPLSMFKMKCEQILTLNNDNFATSRRITVMKRRQICYRVLETEMRLSTTKATRLIAGQNQPQISFWGFHGKEPFILWCILYNFWHLKTLFWTEWYKVVGGFVQQSWTNLVASSLFQAK